MGRKQWRIFLAVAVTAGVLGAMGCGNKAETGGTANDAVAVMADAEIDGEMQIGTETQTGEAETESSGERQDSEPATEASTPLTSQAGNLGNSMEEGLPKFVTDFINLNLNLAKSTIEGIKLERKEAQARAEAERKEAERKEAEARAAEEKAQAEAAAQPAPPASSDNIQCEAGTIYDDYTLLEKVNVDRANNGVAELQWSDSLAQYCKDRIPVVEYNLKNDIWAHEGYTKRENLAYGAVFTSSEANQGWINSEGHHSARIDSDYTMYAAACYQDSETGVIIWIEAFE